MHKYFNYLTLLAVLLAILLFALPLIYWPQLFEAASLPRYFLIAIVSSAALIVWSIPYGPQQIIWHPAFGLILGFLGWAAISTTWNPDPGTALIDIVQLFSMIILAFLAMQVSGSASFPKFIIPALLAGAMLAALIGIGQYFEFNPLEFRKNPNTIPSTFINPNHAAVFFDFIPPLSLMAIFIYRHPILRWLAAITLGLSLAYLLINTSRGSLLAFILVVTALTLVILRKTELRNYFKQESQRRYKELVLALLIPLIILLPPGEENTDRWDTTYIEGKIDNSTYTRFAIYLNSLPAIIDHPLTGTGYGGIRVGFQPYASRLLPTTFRSEDKVIRELHSDPLQYFVELGIPGGLLAVAIFIVLLRTGWNIFSSPVPKDKQLLALCLWLGLIASGGHALVDFPLRLPASAAMFWIFTGALLGLDKLRINTIRQHPKSPLRLFLTITGITGLMFYLLFYGSYLTANHQLYNALVNLNKGNCVAAAQASKNGLEKFASDFMLQTAHSQIYAACNFPPAQKFTAINRVISLDPTNMRARLSLAILYNEVGKPHLAMREFEKVTKVLPHRPTAYAGLGDSMRSLGNTRAARHYYQAALKRDPEYIYAKNQLARLESATENKE